MSVPPPDWLTRAMAWWYGVLVRRRAAVIVALMVGAMVCVPLSSGVNWQPDLMQFFSADSPDAAAMRNAGEVAGIAQQLRVDVHADDADAVPPAVEQLTRELRRTGLFRSVRTGPDAAGLATSYAATTRQNSYLLTSGDLAELASRVNADFINRRFAAAKAALVDPDGELALGKLRQDPLDIASLVRTHVDAAMPASDAHFANGLLLSADGHHAMVVLEPIAPASDAAASVRVMAAVQNAASHLKIAGVWVVGAHRGYAENAARIKRDVSRVSVVGTLAVALAILVFFRSWRGALICFLPPTVGVGLALGVAGLLHLTLPLILLGFTGLLCGSTTDYGIQLIAAARQWAGRDGGEGMLAALAAGSVFGPISMSVVTSVTGFSALALSSAPGLRALGLFVAAATVCIWLVTFLLLPAFISFEPGVAAEGDDNSAMPRSANLRRRMKTLTLSIGSVAFVAVTLFLATRAWSVSLNTNPRSLDGSSPALLSDEAQFAQTWGDLRHRAVVSVSNANAESALEELQQVQSQLKEQQAAGLIGPVLSPADLLPPAAVIQQRTEAWQAFWTPDRQAAVRQMIQTAAAQSGFTPSAFQMDFNPPAVPGADERIHDSIFNALCGGGGMIQQTATRTTLGAVVQLNQNLSPRMAGSWAGELRLRHPGVSILSGDLLFFDASDRARAEAERLAPWVLLAVLIPVGVYFRRPSVAAVASLSLVCGIIWVFAAANLFAGGLNLLSLVPVLFTLGVAIDYGIYAASDPSHRTGAACRRPATFVCALTTTLGSGSMILAGHPALRWLGVTLVAGVAGGYLASLLLVDPLVSSIFAPGNFLRRAGRFAAGVAWFGTLAVLAILVLADLRLQSMRPASRVSLSPESPAQIAPGTFTLGPAWLRHRDGIWEMSVAGTPERIGQQSAALGAPIDLRIENEMLDQLDRRLPRLGSQYLVTHAVAVNLLNLPRYVPPHLQRELYAESLAHPDFHAYLAPTYPRLLDYHALHDVSQMLIDNPLLEPETFGCTGVIATPDFSGDGHLYLARNFDFEGGESFGRQKTVTFVRPADGIAFATVAWPGLSGCVTGMNAQKIGLFINAAATKDFRRIGTPTIMVARQVLQYAGSLEGAVRIVQNAQTFVTDIIVVADGKTGHALVVEKSPARMAAWPVESHAVVANHLQSPVFAADPVNRQRFDEGTTRQRFERATELLDRLKGDVTPQGLADLLRDKKGLHDKPLGWGNRNAIDGLIATHGVIMDLTAGRMWVAAWPYVEGGFVAVDVEKMLAGPGMEPGPSINLPAGAMMTTDGWARYLAAKSACEGANDALRQQQYPQAAADAAKAIDADPDLYLGYELRGRAEFARGQFPEAAGDFAQALSRDPPYSRHRDDLSRMMQRCTHAR